MKNLSNTVRHQANQRGFSLIEVLVGIAIFAIGMLALASLQGALTRSTAEAKVRTTAVNIAEQIIEGQRGFALVTGTGFTYDNIKDVTTPIIFDGTMTRNPTAGSETGVIYSVTQDVTDYYYDLATDGFTETKPTGAVSSDYKTIVVNVAWNDNRDFVIDESTQAGDLGGGLVSVSATISNVSVVTAAQVAGQDDNDIIAPQIVYQPGANPDIVSLGLGGQKFKESLTPEPKVYRDNLESRFDVITYSQGNAGALFLRREEYVAVSCECTLASSDGPAKTPVVWAGDEFTEAETVTKAYGSAISNVAQSSLCDTCCRDHHDGGGGALYDPARPSTEYSGGDHKHYGIQGGSYVEASSGEDYLEACRFVRKDGFFRLTQDFHLEGLNTFAEDFLISTNQVEDYSTYVIGEVYGTANFIDGELIDYTPVADSYVPTAITEGDNRGGDLNYHLADAPPTVETAPRTGMTNGVPDTPADGDLTLGYTYLPTTTTATFQQLRGRSIYIDYLSPDLRETIKCIHTKSAADLSADPTVCDYGDVVLDKTTSRNVLELLPFFEIQTTYLNDWKSDTDGQDYFSLTNQTVTTSDANGPTHSRGKVTDLPQDGADMVQARAYRGVTGLTSTDPINDYEDYLPDLDSTTGWPPGYIEVNTGVTPSLPPNGTVISITLRSDVNGLKAANVGFSVSNATCNYATTSGEFTCFKPTGASSPSLTITGFDKPPKEIRLCSSHQFTPGELPVTDFNGLGAPKTVDLSSALPTPVSPDEPYRLWLTEESCESAEPCVGLACP